MRRHARVSTILAAIGVVVVVPVIFAQAPIAGPARPSAAERIQSLLDAQGTGEDGLRRIREALGDDNPEVRVTAVHLLWAQVGDAALESVRPLADDPDDRVALAVLAGMLAMDNLADTEPVQKALSGRSANLKAQLASAIGDRKDDRFVSDLGKLLSEGSPALRRTAIEAMRATGSSEAFKYFMAATGDGNRLVVRAALNGLEGLGDPRALARVVQSSGSEDPGVRAAAVRAIPACGGTAKHRDRLIALLNDPSPAVRQAVLLGLRDHYTADALPILETAVAADDPKIRRSALAALEPASDRDAGPHLEKLTADPVETVRTAAVLAVGSRGMTAWVEIIAAMAADESPAVREMVASCLGDLGSPDGVPAIDTLARDPDPAVRAEAARSAGVLEGERTFAILARTARDRDLYVRLQTVQALGLRSEPEARALLRDATADKELTVRVAAITELGRIRDRESMPVLKKALQDPAEPVRNAARTAIASIQD